ncbi:MAG: hypothetical protein Q8M32_01380 [Brevundimonas sp.]|nr:hypothetical protein [Brevundimonas sp.]
MMSANPSSTWFQRYLLPGFVFKGFVIGGGYATGRELVEFFFSAGPVGGLLGLGLATLVWSVVCAVAFMFAHMTRTFDYRSFFKALLGQGWIAFEAAFLVFMVLILAVFGAAAGEIGAAAFGLPRMAGSLALVAAIAAVTAFGGASVERMFKYMTVFLYGVYAVFAVLAVSAFGEAAVLTLDEAPPVEGWWLGGLTYAGYNVVGAVIVLPMLRHLTTRREAVVAGLLCGPLAIWPALIFFFCMLAFYPQIGGETLPSDFLLRRLDAPQFHIVFQVMILAALLESGVGAVHGFNERVATAYRAKQGRDLSVPLRLAIALILLLGAVFLADRIGLVSLIATGYRALAVTILILFVAPLLSLGVWKLWKSARVETTPRQA